MSESMDGRAVKKSGLGRGLNSLLGQTTAGVTTMNTTSAELPTRPVNSQTAPQGLLELPLDQLYPNKEQPRRTFPETELRELANSLKQTGIIQPILVRKIADKQFQIIAGERRWRAAQIAELQKVPVIVKTADIRETLEMALIENIQRQDLNPIEEAEAYALLIEKYHLTQQALADKVGKDRVTVSNLLRLTKLPTEVRDMVKSGQVGLGQAKVILGLDDAKIQKKLARKVAKLQLSVRATEALVRKFLGVQNADAATAALDADDDVESMAAAAATKDLASRLQKALGTKVLIEANETQKGFLKIDFYSQQQLNEICDLLLKQEH
jgi:ParB family transcriptional regulator, chromosome partitioning protein